VTSRTKRWLTWVVSLALTAGLLYLFLRKAHLAKVLEEAREASVPYIMLALGLEVLSVFLRAVRWRYMMRAVRDGIPFAPVLKATVLSFTLTGFIPGRVGEVAKPYFLSRWQKLPFTPLLASAVLERGMDLIALVVLWVGFIFFGRAGVSPDADPYMQIFSKISYVFLAAALPLGLFLFWLVPRRRILDRMAQRSARLSRSPLLLKVFRLVLKFAGGLGTFQRKRDILAVFAMSLAIWLLIGGSCWAIIKALGLELPVGASILLLMFVSFGAAVPTPGGVGSVHAAIQLALVKFYEVPEDMGVTAGILGHAVMFFPGILWGLLYVAFGRVRFMELKQAAGSKEHSDSEAAIGR
jgi:uncharacterized protein (TIRG00374 family)